MARTLSIPDWNKRRFWQLILVLMHEELIRIVRPKPRTNIAEWQQQVVLLSDPFVKIQLAARFRYTHSCRNGFHVGLSDFGFSSLKAHVKQTRQM